MPAIKIEIRDLVGVYNHMGADDYVTVKSTPNDDGIRTLHVSSSHPQNNAPVDHTTAKYFSSAKASVQDAIAPHVGSRHANAILGRVLKDENAPSRFRRPEQRAMNKTQIAETLRLTYEEMVRKVARLSPSERHVLLDSLNDSTAGDPAAFMRDPTTNALIYLAAIANNAAQNPRFLDAVHDFECNCRVLERLAPVMGVAAEHRTGVDMEYNHRLENLRQQAEQIRAEYLVEGASERIELDEATRQSLCQQRLESLAPESLAALFTSAKVKIVRRMRGNTLKSLIQEIANAEGELIEEEDGGDTQSLLKSLFECLHPTHANDAVVYQDDGGGHAPEAGWRRLFSLRGIRFGHRGSRARRMKDSVQRKLAAYFKKDSNDIGSARDLAKTVMLPWQTESRALNDDDLKRIVRSASQWHNLQHDTAEALRRSEWFNSDLDELDSAPEDILAPFAAYCAIQGLQYGWNRYATLSDLQRSLHLLNSQNSNSDRHHLDTARSKAAHLLRRGKLSRHLRAQLQKFLNEESPLQSFIRELETNINEYRAAQGAELGPAYGWFREHIIGPAKERMEQQAWCRHTAELRLGVSNH